MNNNVLILERGLVSEILTDADMDKNILIVDRDCEGADPSELKLIEGKKAYIHIGTQTVKSDPSRVLNIYNQAGRKLQHLAYLDPQDAFIKEALEDYLDMQEVSLTEKQKKIAYEGIQSWLGGLDEVIAEAVFGAQFE